MKRTPLRRSRSRDHKPLDRAMIELGAKLALQFGDAVKWRGLCVVCLARTPDLHAHHCVEASFLRKHLRAKVTVPHLLGIQYDPRNALGLCQSCHFNHHYGHESPLRQHHLPASAWEFAREMGTIDGTDKYTLRLEQRYPE